VKEIFFRRFVEILRQEGKVTATAARGYLFQGYFGGYLDVPR